MNTTSHHKLSPADTDELRVLRKLYCDVFQEQIPEVDDSYLEKLLSSQNMLFFVAQKEHSIIGGATAYLLPSLYGDYSELYIYDMAVSEEFQRLGIGTGLLDFIKQYCQSQNIKDIFVQADKIDTQARNFYSKNGGTEINVRHYDFRV